MKKKLRILLLEDLPSDAELVEQVLRKGNIVFEKLLVDTKNEYIKALKEFSPDIILSDHSMPSFNSVEALTLLRASGFKIPFILITGNISEDFAVSVLKMGADDYILKENLNRLPAAITSALKQSRTEKEIQETIVQLKENEKKYRTLVERVSDGFMALDLNWCFTYINKKAEELFSKPCDYLIGKNIWVEFPGAIDKSFYNAYKYAMETQEDIQLKEYSFAIDKWVDSYIYPSATGLSVYFRDITEQKKAEILLKESEEKYRTIFYKSPLPKWIYDCETLRFLEVNDKAVLHYGYTQEEFLNMTIRDIRPKEDVKLLLDDISKINDDPGSRRGNWRHLKKNGELILVETTAHDMDYNNRKARMVVVNDVTENKKAEEALKEGEARYRNVVENIHEALIIEDREGNLVYANTEFYRMFGYSPKDGILSLRNYAAAVSYDEVLQRHNNRLKGMKEAEEFEYKGVRKDGTEIWIEARVSTIIENNKIVGTQSLERDITERKKTEEKLIKSELRFREFFETAPEAVLVLDPVSRGFIDYNENALKLLGCTKEEILGKSPIDFSPEFQADGQRSLEKIIIMDDAALEGNLPIFDWILVNKKGKEIYCEIRLTRLTKTEQPLVRASILDISERVRLEKKVIEEKINKQVEITDAAINAQEQERAFLGEEMHDNINQILATSKLYLDFSMSTEEIRKDMIITGRNFIMDAMEEIRKLSKSLIAPSLGEISLEEAVADMLTNIQLVHKIHFIKEWKNIEEDKLSEKLKLSIFRIIQEQLNNILKHAHAKKVWIKLVRKRGILQLTVKDDGVGFDTAIKRRGVGLKNIASRLSLFKGDIIIISEPGKGCEMQIKFNAENLMDKE